VGGWAGGDGALNLGGVKVSKMEETVKDGGDGEGGEKCGRK